MSAEPKPPSIVFVNQSHGPMFEDLILACNTHNARVALIAGTQPSKHLSDTKIYYFAAPRCRTSSTISKLCSWLLFSAYTAWRILRDHNSHYIITSNPPILLPILGILHKLKKIDYSVLVYDIYPDALEQMRYIHPFGYISRAWRSLSRIVLRNARNVYTISPCLRETLSSQFSPPSEPSITVFPTWADTEFLLPKHRQENPLRKSLGLSNKFVVTYAGNLSPTQDLDTILKAACRLHDVNEIAFVFVGNGSERVSLERTAATMGLTNIHFLPRQPDHMLGSVLTLGDCTFVNIGGSFGGISMPSKLYPALAAGNPILAVTSPGTYLESLIVEHKCGVVMRPGDAKTAADAILQLYRSPSNTQAMARHARMLAESRFSRTNIPPRFAADILSSITQQRRHAA